MKFSPSQRVRKATKFLIVVLALLIVVRLILPFIVLRYANKKLAEMKGYYGHIEDIDLSLIRGAYVIDSIYLNKLDTVTNKQTPFFGARLVDLSIEWKSLFHGSIVGELVFEDPDLRFTKDKVEPPTLRKDSTGFKKLLKDFMPLKVNRLEINHGNIRYIDESSKPPVDIQMTEVQLLAQNLRNSYDSTALLPAKVEATANVYEGTMTFNMKLNPLATVPTFDMNTEVKDMNLPELNDFFKAYAKVDVNKGMFGLYAEVAAKDGKFEGYVKPILKELDVLGGEDREDNLLQKMWEAVVGGAAAALKNQPKDQLATKIPLEGKIKDPSANVWYAVSAILSNAFVRALKPAIDNEINIATVDNPRKEKKTFLEKLFAKKLKK